MTRPYVHGYGPQESIRLQDQAETLQDLLHNDTTYPSGGKVLEVGCGTGSQTIPLAANNPGARITSIDTSVDSLSQAREKTHAAGLGNVEFRQADIFDLPFTGGSFDHIFVCFVLEHLSQPAEALLKLKQVLRPGGTVTVIEGDHGSAYFHPDSSAAHQAIACQVELQRLAGGNALIGRQLYPLLNKSGFSETSVSPRMVYVDSTRPSLVDGFTRKTFTAMIEGVRESAIESGMIEADVFDSGIRDLYRTAETDGVFCYTFFKATGRNA